MKGQVTDLLLPHSITVERFAPCGLFYSPIQQMTFFFPLWAARHSLRFLLATDVEKIQNPNLITAQARLKYLALTRGRKYCEIFEGIKVKCTLRWSDRFQSLTLKGYLSMRNIVWPRLRGANQRVRRFCAAIARTSIKVTATSNGRDL